MRVDIQLLEWRKDSALFEQLNINPHQPLSTLINNKKTTHPKPDEWFSI
jgi:hypothetical protein